MLDWAPLGIAPTTDIRAIKKAYAQRLKKVKPDEEPAAFQALHQAYKAAQQWAKAQGEERVIRLTQEEFEQAFAPQEEPEQAMPLEDIAPSWPQNDVPDAAQNGPQDPHEEPWPDNDVPDPVLAVLREEESGPWPDNDVGQNLVPDTGFDEEALLSQVAKLLDNSLKANRLSNWAFLGQADALLDNQINLRVGDAVFAMVMGFLNPTGKGSSRRKRRYNQLSRPVRRYLDELFNWQSRVPGLVSAFGQKAVAEILKGLDEDSSAQTQRALEGLRGGTLAEPKQVAKPQPHWEQATYHPETPDISPYDTVVQTANWLFLWIPLVAFGFYLFSKHQNLHTWVGYGLFFTLSFTLRRALRKRHKWGYWVMWVVGVALLPLFPVGTAFGFGLCKNLYALRQG